MTNSRTVIEKLKMQFSHPGILEIVISDNEMQYACIEFTKFASDWHFQLINSSLPNLQSNVRTIVTRLRKLVHPQFKGCSAGEHAICYCCQVND